MVAGTIVAQSGSFHLGGTVNDETAPNQGDPAGDATGDHPVPGDPAEPSVDDAAVLIAGHLDQSEQTTNSRGTKPA